MIDAINVLFRWLDFVVIMVGAVYLVVSKLTPVVLKMIADHALFLYNLRDDCKHVQLQNDSLHSAIEEQDRAYLNLRHKFELWHAICDKKKEERCHLQQIIDTKMIERSQVRSHFLQDKQCLVYQIPQVVQRVEQQLVEKFQSPTEQKEYLNTLISVMKERL